MSHGISNLKRGNLTAKGLNAFSRTSLNIPIAIISMQYNFPKYPHCHNIQHSGAKAFKHVLQFLEKYSCMLLSITPITPLPANFSKNVTYTLVLTAPQKHFLGVNFCMRISDLFLRIPPLGFLKNFRL